MNTVFIFTHGPGSSVIIKGYQTVIKKMIVCCLMPTYIRTNTGTISTFTYFFFRQLFFSA